MSIEETMPMRLHGRASVSEFLNDFIVYRGLNPTDQRLPKLSDLLSQSNLPAHQIPRKHEKEYAQVVVTLLRQAHKIAAPGSVLKRLIFVGDTRMSDVGAFQNLCLAGLWDGLVFIGSENSRPEAAERIQLEISQKLFLANRWRLLEEFNQFRLEEKFPIDESTVVVLDLDKTILGGRGRNSGVIDQARVQAVRQTVASLLGDAFDPVAFQITYNQLNQPEYHPFTTDNQDYLAYICLLLGCGIEKLEDLIQRIQTHRLQSFEQFIQQIDEKKAGLPVSLAEFHQDIYRLVQAGDPTPFKVFRRNEYQITASHMGCLPDDALITDILSKEIVITQEVRQLAIDWKSQGAMLFGLSDKPDEASLPTAALRAEGWLPLHQIPTHIVGQG